MSGNRWQYPQALAAGRPVLAAGGGAEDEAARGRVQAEHQLRHCIRILLAGDHLSEGHSVELMGRGEEAGTRRGVQAGGLHPWVVLVCMLGATRSSAAAEAAAAATAAAAAAAAWKPIMGRQTVLSFCIRRHLRVPGLHPDPEFASWDTYGADLGEGFQCSWWPHFVKWR